MRIINKNTFYLMGILSFNYIFPVITIPVIIKAIGFDSYGVYVSIISYVLLISVLVEVGCNYSGVRELASDENKNRIFSIYLYCKLIVFGIVIILKFLVGMYLNDNNTFILEVLIILVVGFNPLWAFQAYQKMKFYSILIFFSKCLNLILFYYSYNYQMALASFFISNFIVCILGYIYLIKKVNLKIVRVNIFDVFIKIKDLSPLILSRFNFSIVTLGLPYVFSLYFNSSIIATYSIAEKIIRAIISVNSPLIQGLLPSIKKTDRWGVIKKLFFICAGIDICFYISLLFLNKYISEFFNIHDNKLFFDFSIWLGVVPVIVLISNLIGVLGFVVDGKYKAMLISSILSSIFIFINMFIFSDSYPFYTLVSTVIISETIISVTLVYFYMRGVRNESFSS
ncbi:oligosaccharide flippase family protein [Photobacterium damselae]|uniref:oligosaccharide flippase family protein n=1 Tax=Photobacterium damselae TaxID=38293 RepID=UPI0025429A13